MQQHSGGVLSGSYAITSDQNFQRFCSNFLATEAQGFDRPMLFTNEEGIDWVNRSGKAWPTTIGAPEARQIGTVVAIDAQNGTTKPIWGMGRHNHENSVAIPGYGHPVVLSGDDSFVTTPEQSQLYSYIAHDSHAVWNDEGDLWAFVADGVDSYFDFSFNSNMSVTGKFVKVPKQIATGRKPDGTELMAADVQYPPPPATGWQTDARTGAPLDGPQWVLEHWGDTQLPQPVFQFVRVEDIAYDKRPGMQNVVYVVDSGRGTVEPAPPGLPSPQPDRSTNGRVWKLVLDKNDPTKVTSFSILIEGDDAPVKASDEIHQPDNIESTAHSLLIHGGSGLEPAVPGRLGRSRVVELRPEGDDGTGLAVRPRLRHEAGGREGEPVRGRDTLRTRTRTRPAATSVRGSRAASSTPRASSARGRSSSTSRRARS